MKPIVVFPFGISGVLVSLAINTTCAAHKIQPTGKATSSRGVIRERRRLALIISSSVLTCLSGISASRAQEVVAPDTIRPVVDVNRVELFTGQFYADGPIISVGVSGSKMSNHFYNHGNGWSADYISGLQTSGSVATVTLGAISDTFSISGTNYTSLEGNGSTLSYSSNTNQYTYVNRDGTTAYFSPIATGSVQYALNNYAGVTSSIVKPDGETITYTYSGISYCSIWGTVGVKPPAQCKASRYATRVQSVTSSNGYQLIPTYASNTVTAASASLAVAPEPIAYIAPTGVSLYNLAISSSAAVATQSFTSSTSGSTTTYDLSDAAGNVYSFQGSVITSVQTPTSSSPNITLTYNGVVSSVSNAHGTTTYSRSTSGNSLTVTVTDALTNKSSYVFDINTGQITSFTDQLGNNTTASIDSYGRVTKLTSPEGISKAYLYDQTSSGATRGNVTQLTISPKSGSSLSNIVLNYGFDPSCANAVKCNQPNWSQDALGNETDYTYDSSSGLLTSVTYPAATSGGVRPQTRYSYSQMQAYYINSSGSIVASGVNTYKLTASSNCLTENGETVNGTQGGTGQFTLSNTAACAGTSDETRASANFGSQTAGTANNLWPVSQTIAAGDGSVSATISLTYDSLGDVLTRIGPLGSGQTTVNYYDANRQFLGMVSPDPDGSGSRTPAAVKFLRNADGAVTQMQVGTVPDQTSNSYANSFTVDYQEVATLDAFDRPIRSTVVGGSTTYAVNDQLYDGIGRAWCSIQYMNMAAVPTNVATGSCSPSQSSGQFGPDRIEQVTYDDNSRVVAQADGIGTKFTVTYSPDGNITSILDGVSNLTSYTYDGFNRRSGINYPMPTTGSGASNSSDYEAILSFDANGRTIQRRLRDGNLITYSYDNLGRVSSRTPSGTAAVSSNDYATSYSYNLAGGLTQILRSADGETLGYTYDALGRVTAENQPFGSIAYQYDAAGDRTQLTWADGFYVGYAYDMVGGVTSISANGATSGVGLLASYSYDSLQRRTKVTYGNGASESYSYDAVSRLAGIQLGFPNTANNDLIGGVGGAGTPISYSPASQISTITRSSGAYAWTGNYNVSRTYIANGLNQYTSSGSVSLGYDARGNLTTSASTTYTYDKLNDLVTVPVAGVSIYYDPLGRTAEYDTTLSTRFYYSGGTPVAEVSNPSNTIMQRYIPGASTDEVVAWYQGVGNTAIPQFLLPDERGSVIAVADSAGNLVGINTYDEFGIPASDNIGRFGYTGQAWFPEVGLYNYKSRWYSPNLGKFMQADTIGYNDGVNWYNYSHGDPINFRDPSGTEVIGAVVGGAFGFTAGFVGQMITDGKFDFKKDVTAGAVSGVTGAALGFIDPSPGILAAALYITAGGVAGAGSDLLSQHIIGGPINVPEVIGSGVGGAIGGSLGLGLGRLAGQVTGRIGKIAVAIAINEVSMPWGLLPTVVGNKLDKTPDPSSNQNSDPNLDPDPNQIVVTAPHKGTNQPALISVPSISSGTAPILTGIGGVAAGTFGPIDLPFDIPSFSQPTVEVGDF